MDIHTVIHKIAIILLCLRGFAYPQVWPEVTEGELSDRPDPTGGYPRPDHSYQDPERVDTVASYSLEEIIITAARFKQSLANSLSQVTLVEKSTIERSPAISLAGVVSGVSGVFVKDYGSASGLKTVSQRGFGAEHTLVLLNGVRISSFQNGLVDLGLFPVTEIHQVEILHGGNSAAFGADAVAGVMNIVTRVQESPRSLDVESSFGSFGYQRLRLSSGFASSNAGFRASFMKERSAEDFPFVFRNGPLQESLSRSNTDFSARYATLQSSVTPWNHAVMNLFAHGYLSERGVGGPVVSNTSLSQARQADEDDIVQLGLSAEVADAATITVTGQTHYVYQRYRDPDLNVGSSVGLDTYFKHVDSRVVSSLTGEVSENLKLSAGGEFARTTASGNSIGLTISRWHGGAFLAAEQTMIQKKSILSNLLVYPSLRFDAFTSSMPSWSPYVALVAHLEEFSLGPIDHIRPLIRSSLSRNFRIPTFNELYYRGGGGFGNSELRPERSTAYDLGGMVSATCGGHHILQLSFFHNSMIDRIVWVPAGTFSVTPKNIRKVETSGLEAAYSWDPVHGNLIVDVNYTFVRSLKRSLDSPSDQNLNTQLPYVPRESANFSIRWSVGVEMFGLSRVEGFVTDQLAGFRYTSEDNTSFLPYHHIVSGGIIGRWAIAHISIDTKLDLQNIFNEEYQLILGYPMPLRSLRLSLRVGY